MTTHEILVIITGFILILGAPVAYYKFKVNSVYTSIAFFLGIYYVVTLGKL